MDIVSVFIGDFSFLFFFLLFIFHNERLQKENENVEKCPPEGGGGWGSCLTFFEIHFSFTWLAKCQNPVLIRILITIAILMAS